MTHLTRKFLFRQYFCLAYWIITGLIVSAQDYRFSKITQGEGLSQGVVNCILQDSRGFMWFGTQDGLNRYDGYEIKVFKHVPGDTNSLSNNLIFSLYEDNNNTLWIGTSGGGLDEYNLSTGKFKSHLHSNSDKNSISDDRVYFTILDQKNRLLVGTEIGLDVLDLKKNKFSSLLNTKLNDNSLFRDRPQCAIIGKDGRVWVGTYGGGINSYDSRTGDFKNYRQPVDPEDKSEENVNLVRSIYEDELGVLVIGTFGKGIQFFDTHSNSFIKQFHHVPADQRSLSNDRIVSITKDGNGLLWIGTFGNGIDLYNKKTGLFKHLTFDEKKEDGLNCNTIRCIYHDVSGAVWIGTEGGGLNVYFPNTSRFRNIKKTLNSENSLKSSTIFAVLQDKDSLLWIGTDKGGLSTLDLKTEVYRHYPELSPGINNSILSLCESTDGKIWVGTTANGLCSYDKRTKEIIWYDEFESTNSNMILNILQDSQKNIWVSTYGAGVFVYDNLKRKFRNYTLDKKGLNSKNVYVTFEDKQHNIWIGTDGGGVNKWDRIKGAFTYYLHNEKDKKSLSSNTILSINQDTVGNIWFGTNCGLDKFNPLTGGFDLYFEKDGLPNDVIYSILIDKRGNLWMSTNNGISKFNPYVENETGTAFTNYNLSNGLQGVEYNQGAYFKSKSGELYMGGENGLDVFNPNETNNNLIPPPVHLTSFKRSGKEVSLDSMIYDKKKLELSWKDNFFSFDFVALDYQLSGKVKFKYKLEGVDEDWSHPTTQRTASYTQLKGGTYTFKVIASNSEGLWEEKGASIIIHIIPPFWQTKWFYSICVLLTIAVFWGVFKFRTRIILRENRILEEKVEERTLELAQKNKDITSSIEYAKRIQLATLPPLEQIYKNFPDSFVFYKPKDIVSGDFYWFGVKDKKKIVAVVDCTGHGVPGAFMSMIGHNLLNQIVNENGTTKPDEILSALNQGVQSALRQGKNVVETSDGMDVAICTIDNNKNELQFAGAFRPLLIINESELKKIEGNKFPIGGMQFGDKKQFTCHTLKMSKGDTIYLTSDGYTDQFGGVKGKKFMAKKFHEILISIQDKTMKNQAIILEQTFNDWRGDIDQVDDILILGIRI